MLLLLLEPVVLLPCSFCFSSSSCSSCPPWCLVVLVVNVVPPRFSLPWLSSCSSYIFCLRACPPAGRAAQGEPPRDSGQRSRAKLCAHLLDVPICRSGLRRRSTTWSLTAQSSRARTVRWREFRAKLFFRAPQASAGGGSRCRQSRRSRAQPPFPGEGARANAWGQLPSTTAEMRHRASSHCTR